MSSPPEDDDATDRLSSSSRAPSKPSVPPGGPVRNACEPCRNRKIKCSGERPACARCAKVGKTCVYQAAANSWAYIAALERRVESLEKAAAAAAATSSTPHHRHDSTRSLTRSRSRRSLSPLRRDRTTDLSQAASQARDFSPANSIPLTISRDPSTITSDAQLVARLPIAYDLVGELSRHHGKGLPSTLTHIDRSIFPSPEVVSQLIDHFRTCTGAEYPIFHIPTLLHQVDQVCFGEGLVSYVDTSIVILVLAVAATSLRRGSPLYPHYKPRASDLWNYAQIFLPSALDTQGLTRLQLLLIHFQYVCYNPVEGSVWDLSGAIMRCAIDLDLHRERQTALPETNKSLVEEDMRRRLFWISYNLDRNISTALGRPPSIPDDWINIAFPSVYDDALIAPTTIFPGEPSPLKSTAIHRFRLRQLQSEVHDRLYTNVKHADIPSQRWFESVVKRLDDWRDSLPSGTEYCTTEWWMTKYHLTLILLYRPSPGNSHPSETHLIKSLSSAGAMMRAYNNMHRKGFINTNWFTTYQLFIAGVAYLNALWQARRNGWTIVEDFIDALLVVQVAMSVMEALAALTPGTYGIRNAYEAVTERIIRFLSTQAHSISQPNESIPSLRQQNLPTIPISSPASIPDPMSLFMPSEPVASAWTVTSTFGENTAQVPSDPFAPEPNDILNPINLEDFFQQPLWELSTDEWERAFGNSSPADLSNQMFLQ